MAVRRPDLVETLVTLGSPVRDQLAVHPRTRLAVTAVGLVYSTRDEVVRGDSCLDPAAEQIAVTTSHVAWGSTPACGVSSPRGSDAAGAA